MTMERTKTFFQGSVKNHLGDRTLIVEVVTYKTHAKYRKKIRVSKRYKVDGPTEKSPIGSSIRFTACRPISRDKRFVVVD